jgi:hypothetical protein
MTSTFYIKTINIFILVHVVTILFQFVLADYFLSIVLQWQKNGCKITNFKVFNYGKLTIESKCEIEMKFKLRFLMNLVATRRRRLRSSVDVNKRFDRFDNSWESWLDSFTQEERAL